MHQAPTARESEHALHGVRFDAADAADAADTAGAVSPLVLDLGCGFGVGLLSMVQPSPLAAGALAPPPVNVLGCDACALKVGNARPTLALTLTLTLALTLGLT